MFPNVPAFLNKRQNLRSRDGLLNRGREYVTFTLGWSKSLRFSIIGEIRPSNGKRIEADRDYCVLRSMARTGDASIPFSFSGSAISSYQPSFTFSNSNPSMITTPLFARTL